MPVLPSCRKQRENKNIITNVKYLYDKHRKLNLKEFVFHYTTWYASTREEQIYKFCNQEQIDTSSLLEL